MTGLFASQMLGIHNEAIIWGEIGIMWLVMHGGRVVVECEDGHVHVYSRTALMGKSA